MLSGLPLELDQHAHAGGALDEGGDGAGLVGADDEVALRKTVACPEGSGVAEVALRLVANWECPPDPSGALAAD